MQGLRDGAIIRVMSDTLARISEVAALQCSDVEPDITGGGTVHIRASKTDQRGEGSTRFIGAPTMAALERYLARAGHATGPLFRRVLRGGHGSAAPLAAGSIGEIVRKRLRAVGVSGRLGGHSLRVGSARELAAAGASVAELQQAGGWRSPATPEPPAGRWRGAATRWGRIWSANCRMPRCCGFDLETSAVTRWWCWKFLPGNGPRGAAPLLRNPGEQQPT